jgi:ElaB/YqjD/DUF883 family membrane-anchored ribosome-binding protein
MNDRTNATVEMLRRESERTRAELAGTVTELRGRVGDTASEIQTMASPSHIKAEIKSFIREERQSLMQSLERKVRDNPLQAAAIGAALAYPALGLLRAIPAPLLMIGAGIFLTSTRGKQTMADATAKMSDAVDQGMTAASEMAGDLRDTVAKRAEPVTQALGEAAASITERTDALAQDIRRNVGDVRDTVSQTAASVSDKLKGAAETVEDRVSQTYNETRNSIGAKAQYSQSAVMQWVDENPLVVAGIGAAIGAFIAAALPPSSAENAALGKSSDHVKDKAREMASEGLEKARRVAADVVGDVQAAAAREGLDAPSLQHTADGIAQSVKSVAERGVQAALNGTKPHETQENSTTSDTHAKRQNTQAGR